MPVTTQRPDRVHDTADLIAEREGTPAAIKWLQAQLPSADTDARRNAILDALSRLRKQRAARSDA